MSAGSDSGAPCSCFGCGCLLLVLLAGYAIVKLGPFGIADYILMAMLGTASWFLSQGNRTKT